MTDTRHPPLSDIWHSELSVEHCRHILIHSTGFWEYAVDNGLIQCDDTIRRILKDDMQGFREVMQMDAKTIGGLK